MNKKMSLLLAFAMAGLTGAFAQNDNDTLLVVQTKTGKTVEYATRDIEKISFVETESNSPFVITHDEVTSTSAHLYVSVDPSFKGGYYYDVLPESYYQSYGGDMKQWAEDLVDAIVQSNPQVDLGTIMAQLLTYGDNDDSVVGLEPETKYYCYAIGLDANGKATTEFALDSLVTLEAPDPADCTFTFSFDDMSTEAALITTKPSDASARYWMSIEEVETWPGDAAIAGAVKNTLETYAANNGMTVEEVVAQVGLKGEKTELWSDLEAGKAYYAYAYTIDEAGNQLGKLFKERFVTPTTDVSDANVTLTYRYFDGDELAKTYPDEYANAAGRVFIQVHAAPNASAVDWFVALAKGDLTDTTLYPDDVTMDVVTANGQQGKTISTFYADWSEVTLFGYAVDLYGIYGALNRLAFTPTKEEATPASELKQPSEVKEAFVPMQVAKRNFMGQRLQQVNKEVSQAKAYRFAAH